MINKTTQNRNITLAEITQQSANDITRFIYEMNEEDKNLVIEKRTPIKLIINSEGGDVYSGFGIVEVIRSSKTPIHTICHGQAQSMSLLILSVGHKRYIGPYSTVMYHEINWETEYSPGKFHKQEMNEADRMQFIYDDILLEATNLTHEQLDKVKNHKGYWYMGSADAMRFDIVDEILI